MTYKHSLWGLIIPGIVVVGCYLGLGIVAAKIEKHAWSHINKVRRILFNVVTDDPQGLKYEDYHDTINDWMMTAYLCACSLVITATVFMTIMTFFVGTQK